VFTVPPRFRLTLDSRPIIEAAMQTEEAFEYVFGRIIPEVEIVLDVARKARDSGGNSIRLGSLHPWPSRSHRVMGHLVPREQRIGDGDEGYFNSFFKCLGPGCAHLLEDGYDVYGKLRSGMVHHYFPKVSVKMVLFSDTDTAFDVFGEEVQRRTLQAGVGVTSMGNYYFVIDRYLTDFKREWHDLHSKLLDAQVVELPKTSPFFRMGLNRLAEAIQQGWLALIILD
jgi:hypothetical protein